MLCRRVIPKVPGRLVTARYLGTSKVNGSYASDKETHFGYETVSEAEKAEKGKMIIRILDA